MTSKKWQIAHWTYLALLICIMPICVFLNIFPCSPIATYFTLQSIAEVADPKTIKCLDQNAISLATRYLHIVTDWLLLPVPLIIIWRLQMPVSRKVRLMLVFCVGLISSIASIIRNVLTERLTTDIDITCKIPSVMTHRNLHTDAETSKTTTTPSTRGILSTSSSQPSSRLSQR